MGKVTELLKTHRRKIYLTWILAGFVAWMCMAYIAVSEDPGSPPTLYFYAATICWILFHIIPVALIAIIIRVWIWMKPVKHP